MSLPESNDVVLCIDVGNSQTVIGIYRGLEVVEYWRLPTPSNTTSDEIFLRAKLLIDDSSVNREEIKYIGLSSVVPALERIWTKGLGKFLSPEVEVVSSTNCLDTPICYDAPKLLGVDRIANILALKDMGHECALAIDLGTATTFDLLNEGGFHGGCILPGVSASLEVLTDRALRLMPVSLEWPDKVIGQNSESSLRSGLMYGYLGQIEYLIKRFEEEINIDHLHVIGTGGWYTLYGEKITRFDEFDPFLTLRGIRCVAMQKFTNPET